MPDEWQVQAAGFIGVLAHGEFLRDWIVHKMARLYIPDKEKIIGNISDISM
jgi:hypothetical protein